MSDADAELDRLILREMPVLFAAVFTAEQLAPILNAMPNVHLLMLKAESNNVDAEVRRYVSLNPDGPPPKAINPWESIQ